MLHVQSTSTARRTNKQTNKHRQSAMLLRSYLQILSPAYQIFGRQMFGQNKAEVKVRNKQKEKEKQTQTQTKRRKVSDALI